MGNYDGQGHTVSGLYINSEADYQGLFGNCSYGIIKNLNIKESQITSTGGYVGAIAGNADNIENCSNSGEIVGGYVVGGICGYDDSDSIKNCYNTGKVIASSYSIGGICGEANRTEIMNCYNTGEINGGYNVGGICGNSGNVGGNYLNVYNCFNVGKISCREGEIGGIVGKYGAYSGKVTLKNNYNLGEIKVVNDNYGDAGGIIGNSYYPAIIEDCFNKGPINGKSYIGGIIGKTDNKSTINNCYNEGEVIVQGDYSGGIVGYGYGTISSVYNTGVITGNAYIGGILGQNSNTSITKLLNCYYETGTASYGIGTGTNTGNDNYCTSASREEITSHFETLDGYKADTYGINDGLPILSWQTDNDKLNLINGDGAFVEDTENINNGYPILAWQAK